MVDSELIVVKRLDGEIINSYFSSSLKTIISPICKSDYFDQAIINLIEFRLFLKKKYPFFKELNRMEIDYSDKLRYFILNSLERNLRENDHSFPVRFQKMIRAIYFLMKLRFFIRGDYLSFTDLIIKSRPKLTEKNTHDAEFIFSSRQEAFGLISEMSNIFLNRKMFLSRNEKTSKYYDSKCSSCFKISKNFTFKDTLSDHIYCQFCTSLQMDTYDLSRYPINAGLKDFQSFRFNGDQYFIYGYKNRIIILDQNFKNLQNIQTSLSTDISCLSIRASDGTIAASAYNIVTIFRLNDYKLKWDFALNLTLNFNVGCISFSATKYLAVAGNQLTIWEEVQISLEDENEDKKNVWFNVFSSVMPRSFTMVQFSPCEAMFATSENNGFPLIKIWHIQDQDTTTVQIQSKNVNFAYLPKYFDCNPSFSWINIEGKSLLITYQSQTFYFWDFECCFPSIKISIFSEFSFKNSALILKNTEPTSPLYFLSYESELIKLSNLEDLKSEIITNDIALNVSSKFEDKNSAFHSNDRICIFSDTETSFNLIMASNRSVSIAALDKNNGILSILKKISFFSDKMTFLYEHYGLVVFLNSENKLCIASTNNLSQTSILDKANVVDAIVFPIHDSKKLKCLSMDGNGKLCFYIIDERGHIIHRSEFDHVSLGSKLLVHGNYFVIIDAHRCIVLIDEKSLDDNLNAPYHIVRIEENFDHIDVLGYDKSLKSLKAIGLLNNESKCSITTYESSTGESVESFTFVEPGLSNCIYDYGKYLCLYANSKVIRASKLSIVSGSYSFQNICRNMYGDVIQIKYFEDSYGLPYFLSLHEKYFLVFNVKTSQIGELEVLLLKAIPIPENELTGKSLEIVIAGGDKIYLRDDCNAHEVNLSQQQDPQIQIINQDNVLNVSVSEIVMIILAHKDWKSINLETFRHISMQKENLDLIRSAFEFVEIYKKSVDLFASKFLFSLFLRLKRPSEGFNINIWSDLLDYELLLSYRSDSQNILIDACCSLCEDALSFEKFKLFKFSFWVRNIDHLKNLLEKVARFEYSKNPENLDLITFLYVILGKYRAASAIWTRSNFSESKKMCEFLNLNFNEQENRIKAEKNAFALIGKQRFELALAFFILAGKVGDAQQLSRKMDIEFKLIVDLFYNLSEELKLPNLLVNVDNGQIRLETHGNSGIFTLLEIQRPSLGNTSKPSNDLVKSYVEYAFAQKFTFLALFYMRHYGNFEKNTVDTGINVLISQISKEYSMPRSEFKNEVENLYGLPDVKIHTEPQRQFDLSVETGVLDEQSMFW